MKFAHALITGISGQLGFALAKYLMEHHLVSHLSVCARSTTNDAPLQALATQYGVTLHLSHIDVRDDTALSAFIAHAEEIMPLSLVIANAGVSLTADQQGLEDLFEINRGFDTNTKATIKTLYLVLSLYRKRTVSSPLSLVAISSLASLLPMRSSPIYSASKAAINMYVESLREALTPQERKSVSMTLVLPGFIKTAMSDRFIGNKAGMISAEQAATKIITAVLKRRPLIAFPKYLYWGMKLGQVVPKVFVRPFVHLFDFSVVADRDRATYEQKEKQ